jgi:hypothetical protein
MIASELVEQIVNSISEPEHYAVEGVSRVRTFEAAGVMTADEGLVVSMDDGSEFQVTIKQSR